MPYEHNFKAMSYRVGSWKPATSSGVLYSSSCPICCLPHNVLISSRTISPMRAKVGKTLKKSNRASLLVDQLQSTACSHHIYRRVQYMVIDWGYKKTVTISVTDNSAPIVNQDKKLTLCNGLQKLADKGLVFVTGCKTFPRTLEGAIKSIYGYL